MVAPRPYRVCGTVRGKELSHDRECLGGVDRQAGAEEGFVAHAPRVEVASVLVAHTGVPVVVVTALFVTRADGQAGARAWVRGVGSSHGVGFPDIHLRAAGTPFTGTSVGVVA